MLAAIDIKLKIGVKNIMNVVHGLKEEAEDENKIYNFSSLTRVIKITTIYSYFRIKPAKIHIILEYLK